MDSLNPPTSVLTRLNAIFLPVFAALVITANYVPFRLLLRVRKIAACTLVIVLAVVNTFTLVNAIIWPNNNTADWWSGIGLCDVQVALKIPLNTLLASSSAYLSWDLANALDTDNPRLVETRRSRHRRVAIELVFCFGIPVLQAVLHYLIQAGRFAVVTVYGCSDYVDDSWPTPIIGSMWPPIFALINCYFAVLVILRLRKHRGVLSNTLSSTGSGLSARRFFKLFFLSGSTLLVYLPVTLYFFYVDVDYPYEPYSWSRVHDPTVWYEIPYLTTELSPRTQYIGWVGVAMACFLVILYGFGTEGKEIYKGWLASCGLGKIFPSLLESRELLIHGRDSLSRSSHTPRFDMISRAIHYYDNVRKGSQAPSDSTTSRKGSGATFEHASSISGLSGSTSATVDLASMSLSSTSSRPLMTPAVVMAHPERMREAPLFATPLRTHTNLPYILFGPKNSSTVTSSENFLSQDRTQKNSNPSRALNSMETSIWGSVDLDDDLDPHAPRMGTRAYRERERRIHEQMHIGVLPDTVTLDFGAQHPAQGEIRVEQKLEILEELTASPYSP